MFTKTFCKPNSIVEAIPAGLLVKLQYNEYGLLQDFSVGFDTDLSPEYSEIPESEFANKNKVFSAIKKIVPPSLTTTGGTTWIYGVLYEEAVPCCEGPVPEAMTKDFIDDIESGKPFAFYAAYAKSLAAALNGPLVIRNFLSANKFESLPQAMVPVYLTEETLKPITNPKICPFNPDFIYGFIVFEDLECRYAKLHVSQINVTKNIDPYVDSDGYLKGDVIDEAGKSHVFGYSTIVHHSVTRGSTLLLEYDPETGVPVIIATRCGRGAKKPLNTVAKEVKCPICNKLYTVGLSDAPAQCDDEHCLSRLYNDACKMLKLLGLPGMTFDSYSSLVATGKIVCLTDLLDLEPCRDIEIKTTLANAMHAVVPTSVVANPDILERFANKCNNSVETVVYYLENPRRIETDLDITEPSVARLVIWLQDPYNVSTLTTLFSRVKISAKLQKFDGDPIFRGVTLAITGRFKRGDHDEITAILKSYSADVVSFIQDGRPKPNAVIIGSLNENISGQLIQKARSLGVPQVYEDDFFKMYEIDDDLAKNLL